VEYRPDLEQSNELRVVQANKEGKISHIENTIHRKRYPSKAVSIESGIPRNAIETAVHQNRDPSIRHPIRDRSKRHRTAIH
jgi:hypothetical protein